MDVIRRRFTSDVFLDTRAMNCQGDHADNVNFSSSLCFFFSYKIKCLLDICVAYHIGPLVHVMFDILNVVNIYTPLISPLDVFVLCI